MTGYDPCILLCLSLLLGLSGSLLVYLPALADDVLKRKQQGNRQRGLAGTYQILHSDADFQPQKARHGSRGVAGWMLTCCSDLAQNNASHVIATDHDVAIVPHEQQLHPQILLGMC